MNRSSHLVCRAAWELRKLLPCTAAASFSLVSSILPAHALSPTELWETWPPERFVSTPAPCLRHAELSASLDALAAKHAGALRVEEVGRSVQGRSIRLLTLGRGARKVLLWSQMHGDEPTATPALLDLVDALLRHSSEPEPRAILEELTLLVVPMLNPDGAEVYDRRNAQGIDINRDALDLSTPEGRLLKRLRDEHQPILGFNLHDQNRRTTVGETGRLATHAVLAVAGDEAGTLTPGRLRAKRACAAIVATLEPFVPGGISRYDEDWSPRAFGDNLTAWGTPVVLLESGGLPPGRALSDLVRLNVTALFATLTDLARDDLTGHDPDRYERLARNTTDRWADVVVRGGSIAQPSAAQPYRADLAFQVLASDRRIAGCSPEPVSSRLVEVGDARLVAPGRVVDASGQIALAPFVAGAHGWRARRWLDAAALERLARMGVGTLRWRVPARRERPARALAEALAGEGRARLEVQSSAAEPPWLEISRSLGEPADDTVAAQLDALAGPRWRTLLRAAGSDAVLARLWNTGANAGRPPLRPQQPASFVLLTSSDGSLDLEQARIRAVWIDGTEIEGGSR